MQSQNISDKGAKRTKSTNESTKQSIVSSISSTELTKLKSLIKFNNQPEVPSGQSLGPKALHSEQQLQSYKPIKCQQASKYSGCWTLTNPMKNYIF